MRAALTAEEKLTTLTECRGCDYLGESGCQYESLMGVRLPCKSGRVCHFNPRQPIRNQNGDPIEITEKEIKIMPAKINIDDTKAFELYNQGKGDIAIAAYFGCSIQTISRWRSKRGLSGHCGKVPAARQAKQAPEPQKEPDITINKPLTSSNAEPVEDTSASSGLPVELTPLGLLKLLNDNPGAGLLIDGAPVKSITVFLEYNLSGKLLQTQIGLLSE